MENVKTLPFNVSEQLKNVSIKHGENLDVIRHYYFQERWLYRLSISSYQERFLIKGDHLLFALTNRLVKPSNEIFLSAKQITHDISKLQHVFKEICTIKVPDDGIRFLVDEIEITSLKNEISVEIPVILEQMKTYIQIKISYRDNHILKPKPVKFPALLEMETPVLLGYSTEVIIAEKFAAIINLQEEGTIMKDFYDVYLLLNTQKLEGRVLQEAVLEVFDYRRIRIEKDQLVLSEKFHLDPQRNEHWLAYIEQHSISFEDVIKRFQKALVPIYNVVVTEDEFFGKWEYELQDWK